MFQFPIRGDIPEPPTLFFTTSSNTRAERVLDELRRVIADHPAIIKDVMRADMIIFPSVEAVREAFESDRYQPGRAVVLFDGHVANKHFRPLSRSRSGAPFPAWSSGAMWGVEFGTKLTDGTHKGGDRSIGRVRHAAEQLRAWFGVHFGWIDRPLDEKGCHSFPWGPTARGEASPVRIHLPAAISETLARLNSGPDMIGEVNANVRAQLPVGSRISWRRVPGEVATYPRKQMEAAVSAIAAFERACAVVVNDPLVARELMTGVNLRGPYGRLEQCYLRPHFGDIPIVEWSIRRPDFHVNGPDLVSSENDEMPGGFFDLWHIDRSYGINTEAWEAVFDGLFAHGPLAFVVSDQWSQVYLTSARWMAEELRALGREVYVITTTDARELVFQDDGVYYQGARLGTVWRQFPIFETEGPFAELVFASQEGRVRMVPEFAHFGNKSWYAIFWTRHEQFRALIDPDAFVLLEKLIPHTRLILPSPTEDERTPQAFASPTNIIHGILREDRAHLVLKLTGASDKTARSLGVLVGAAQTKEAWEAWIWERFQHADPFIIQRRFETTVEHVAVLDTKTGGAERFPCKVLMRPWCYKGQLISTSCAVTPHWTTKVHGMYDMAVVPVNYI